MDKQDKMKNVGIVFVAEHWGEYYGGIDVFNEYLCKATAYVVDHSSVATICLVFGVVNTNLIYKYRDKGIYIVEYRASVGEKEEDIQFLSRKKISEEVPCKEYIWIGHDLRTGWKALALAKLNQNKDKSAVIFHTDYFTMNIDRESEQQILIDGMDFVGKNEKQIELAEKADCVFCVGPVIYDKFKNLPNAYTIIPGLNMSEKEKPGEYRVIMTGGRFNESTESQKRWLDVCDGIAEALKIMKDRKMKPQSYQVIIYGLTIEKVDLKQKAIEIKGRIKSKSGIDISVSVKKFDATRIDYLNMLAKSDVFVMSSWKESFGLVAWEALELGIPVVISENSGMYRYMEKELGYLLRGLCGSFEAGIGNTEQEMGKAIADILFWKDKIKKSTELLQKEMSKRNKWETLAIKITKYLGIKDVMSDDIFQSQDCFEFTYAERKLMLDELKKRIENQQISDKIVFFDGISSKNILEDKKFFISLIDMMSLEMKQKVEVYFVYPTKKAIEERITQINEEKVDLGELKKKADKISELKESLEKMWEEKYFQCDQLEFENCLSRIHLVPLNKSPSVYINILDNDWYFTIKYEKRSSESATMKLANSEEGRKQKQSLIDHMKFILNDSSDNEECRRMLEQISIWGE